MPYCNNNEKATVSYSFNGTQNANFETTGSIEISTGIENNSGSNYNPNGYQITFYSPNNYKNIIAVVTDYQLVDTGQGGDYKYTIKLRDCDGVWGNETLAHNNLVFDTSVHCPGTKNDSSNCFIKVTKNGAQIHKATGKCPVNFTVACGDNCPDGYMRCEKPEYPGYCCIPCDEIRNGIVAAISEIRSKNRG